VPEPKPESLPEPPLAPKPVAAEPPNLAPVPAPAAPEPTPDPEPTPTPAAADPSAAPDAAAIRRQWTTVMDKVRERSRTLSAMLAGAMVSGVDGTTLVLSHESANLAKRLGEQRNLDVIQDALRDALGLQWRVRYEVGAPAAVPTMSATPAASDEEEEAELLAEAASSADPAPRRDPEEVALELLQNELGARRIDG